MTDPKPAPSSPPREGEFVAQALLDKFKKREVGLTQWLNDTAPHCFDDQKHLDEHSVERVYWHYGYMVAIRDMLRALLEKRP